MLLFSKGASRKTVQMGKKLLLIPPFLLREPKQNYEQSRSGTIGINMGSERTSIRNSELGTASMAIYAMLVKKFDRCWQKDVKIVIGDMNARIGRKEMYKLTCKLSQGTTRRKRT